MSELIHKLFNENSNDCYNECSTWENVSKLEDYEQDKERYKCDDCGNIWVVPITIVRDFGDRDILKEEK